jgi:translation initiation factor IF-2
MMKLQEMGEFIRSASSTVEAPLVRRLREDFSG